MSLVVRPGVAAVLVAVAAVAGCTVAEPPAAETAAEASALTVPGSVEAEPAAYLDCDFSDHVDSALEAVWQVKAGLSNGTAFHIGGGQWLTAEHVISGRSTATLHNSGASITATVEAANRAGDTALLLTSSAPSPLGFGSLSEIGPGHQAYAVGFPLYDAPQASVSRGIVSRIEHHAGLEQVILTDAAVNPGNSGGPLLNECGQVIGMNVSRLIEDDAVGLNYAVAEPTLRRRIAELGGTITDDPPAPTTQRITPTTTAAAAPPTTTSRASPQPAVPTAPPTRPIPEWEPFVNSENGRTAIGSMRLSTDLDGGITFVQDCSDSTLSWVIIGFDLRPGTAPPADGTEISLSVDYVPPATTALMVGEIYAYERWHSAIVPMASWTAGLQASELPFRTSRIRVAANIGGIGHSEEFDLSGISSSWPECPTTVPSRVSAPAVTVAPCPGVSQERFDRLDQMEAQYLAEMDERIVAAVPGSAAHTRLVAARADLAANLAVQRMELWAEHDAYLRACRASPG